MEYTTITTRPPREQVIVCRGMKWDEYISVFLVRDNETAEEALNRTVEALTRENDMEEWDLELIEGDMVFNTGGTPTAMLRDADGKDFYKLTLQTTDMIYA